MKRKELDHKLSSLYIHKPGLAERAVLPLAAHLMVLLTGIALDALLANDFAFTAGVSKTKAIEWVLNAATLEMAAGMLLALIGWQRFGRASNHVVTGGVCLAVAGAMLAVNAYWIISLIF